MAKLRNKNRRNQIMKRKLSSLGLALVATGTLLPARAHASFLHGETLDKAANVLSWVVLFVVPVVVIVVFWLVHIMPEKIAIQKKHPQAKAIQVLCLLSLAFGGLLWPLAWLWAYSKPVLHKMAYGTDVDETVGHGDGKKTEPAEDEVKRLREQVATLEAQLKTTAKGGQI
jgi:CBS domain containing-hemolysin-like protein